MRIRLHFIFIFVLLSVQSATAATFTAVADGNWGDGSTWDQGGLVPGGGDSVVISGYTVLLDDYTGDVTVNAITMHNLTGINAARLLIYENVTVNVNAINMNAEDDFEDVELQIYDQATVSIAGKLIMNRSSDNNKLRMLYFYVHGNANVTIEDNFEYYYLNSHGLEANEEIRVDGSAQLNLNGNLEITKVDGGGEFNMFLAGGADINLAGKFFISQQDGGDFMITIQDSTSFMVGDTATFQNQSGTNQIKFTINQFEGFVNFTDEVNFESLTADNLIIMETGANSTLRFNKNFKMVGNSEGDIGLLLGDTSTLEIKGRFLRPNKYGFLRAIGQSRVSYSGNGAQMIASSNVSGSGTDSFYIANVSLDNSSGSPLVLEGDLEVNDHFEFREGIIQTSTSALLVINDGATISAGSETAYIDGPVLKKGSTNGGSFIFPIGAAGVYAPLEISAVSNSSFEYQAQYFSEPPPIEDGIEAPIESVVRNTGYWSIAKSAGADDVGMTLHWSDAAATGIDTPDSLLVAGLTDNGDGTLTWQSYGNSGTTGGTGSGVSGSVSSSFSEPPPMDEVTLLTLGSTDPTAQVLPVELIRFGATVDKETVLLTWETGVEENADYFLVERSVDGKSFTPLAEVMARGGQAGSTLYTAWDKQPSPGANYYRLKQVDLDGTFDYSKIISITNDKGIQQQLLLYPNPVKENFTISGFDNQQELVEIRVEDQLGRLIYKAELPVTKGAIWFRAAPIGMNQPGVYYLRIKDGWSFRTLRVVKINN